MSWALGMIPAAPGAPSSQSIGKVGEWAASDGGAALAQ